MYSYAGLSGAFRYWSLVLFFIAVALPYKVPFLATIITFNVFLIPSLGGIELYRAGMLSLLNQVVMVKPSFGIWLVLPISVVAELSGDVVFLFQASFIKPVVKFNS